MGAGEEGETRAEAEGAGGGEREGAAGAAETGETNGEFLVALMAVMKNIILGELNVDGPMSHQSLEDIAQLDDDEEDFGKSKGQGEEWKQEAEDDVKETTGENPLEKYMKMVLEARGEQQEKVRLTLCCHSKDFHSASAAHLDLYLDLVGFSASSQRRGSLEPRGQDSVGGERQQVTEACGLAGGELTVIVNHSERTLLLLEVCDLCLRVK